MQIISQLIIGVLGNFTYDLIKAPINSFAASIHLPLPILICVIGIILVLYYVPIKNFNITSNSTIAIAETSDTLINANNTVVADIITEEFKKVLIIIGIIAAISALTYVTIKAFPSFR